MKLRKTAVKTGTEAPWRTLPPVKSLRLVVTLILLVGTAVPGEALDINGFLPPSGEGALALSFTGESYDHFWRGGRRVSNPSLEEVSTDCAAAWLTWGLRDDLALVVNVAGLDIATTGTAGFEDDGLQDLTVLAKYRAASFVSGRARHSIVTAAGFRTPLSDYRADAPVSLGDGTTDGLLRLVYQFESRRFYFSQQLGFDVRGGDAPNGFPFASEVGYTTGRFTFSGFYCRYIAVDGTDIGDSGFTFPSNREEFERLGAKIYSRISSRLGLIAAGFTTLDGRNSGDTSGLTLGATFSF